jgi:CheY-like chemotaxis protein
VILIVEDDPDTRHAIGEYLTTLFPTARVVTSESGETALALAQRIAPRVVLLDLRLGGMQGFEFAERLRRHLPGADTAIVALTGDTSPDTLLRAEEAGFAAFLRKPADLDRLEAVLRPLLAKA